MRTKLIELGVLFVLLVLVLTFVFGCKNKVEADEPEIGYICPCCGQCNTEYLYKADPVVLERRVGAVAEINYKLHCSHCDKEIRQCTEPNEGTNQ